MKQAKKQKTHLDYMTCTEMYGNGVGTGMEAYQVQMKRIIKERLLALAEWGVAGLGAMRILTLVQPVGAAPVPATGTTISAFGLSAPEFANRKFDG